MWHYEYAVHQFNIGLHTLHPYESNPWSWLVLGRPVLSHYRGRASGHGGCRRHRHGQAQAGHEDDRVEGEGRAVLVEDREPFRVRRARAPDAVRGVRWPRACWSCSSPGTSSTSSLSTPHRRSRTLAGMPGCGSTPGSEVLTVPGRSCLTNGCPVGRWRDPYVSRNPPAHCAPPPSAPPTGGPGRPAGWEPPGERGEV